MPIEIEIAYWFDFLITGSRKLFSVALPRQGTNGCTELGGYFIEHSFVSRPRLLIPDRRCEAVFPGCSTIALAATNLATSGGSKHDRRKIDKGDLQEAVGQAGVATASIGKFDTKRPGEKPIKSKGKKRKVRIVFRELFVHLRFVLPSLLIYFVLGGGSYSTPKVRFIT